MIHYRLPARYVSFFSKCVLVSLLLSMQLQCFAQDDEKEDKDDKKSLKLHHSVEAGLTIGGQVSNDNFIYKSGWLLQYTADVQVSTRVYYGIGGGIEKFDDETFFPLYASFKGLLKKKDSTPYLTAQMGYAFASNTNYYSYAGYRYRGGILFSPGFGYKLSVKDKYSVLFSVNYKHQFARVQYKTFDSRTFQDEINYDFISFRIGLLL